MTEFSVVEAKTYHVGRIIREMRDGQKEALLALGIGSHGELSQIFHRSSFRRAWMIDGKLAAVGGVIGTLASAEGYVWLVVSRAATSYPVEMVREARRQLSELLGTKRSLITTILCQDRISQRFARFLGFRSAGEGRPGMSRMMIQRDWPLIEAVSPAPFVVFALPRSGTKWLSTFLSYRRWNCHHDLPVAISSKSELLDILGEPHSGSVETGLSSAWRVIRERFPEARFAVIRRPVDEVKKSAAVFGWQFPDGYLEAENKRLDEIAEQPGTLTIDFADLHSEEGSARIFEHCLETEFDRDWWADHAPRNIQIDMDARYQALMARQEDMGKLFSEIAETVTIQVEGFDGFYRDGQELFAEHAKEAGPMAGLPLKINETFARALDSVGGLQVVTARKNGQMIGYIVFLINPSFESADVLLGFQNVFFVRREFRGIGLKIREFAKAELKKRGVKMLILRSGVRASGPKQENLFKREGAQFMGKLYALQLEVA